MADIRCSHCGKDNPDFLDVCQFCQTPLVPPDTLHIGEEPTKKNTDELEEILPDWLKEARQQGKNEEAVDDAFRSSVKPRVPDEPPDLLAGLMSQSESDEEDVPDWLAGIQPVEEKGASLDPSSADEGKPSDFFAQFDEQEPQPAAQGEDAPDWMKMDGEAPGQKDELTGWFTQTSSEPGTPFTADAAGEPTSGDNDWMKDLEAFGSAEPEPPAEKVSEDLSWLRDLEAAAKGTGELPELPEDSASEPASPISSEEDLSWLNNLGAATSASDEPATVPPPSGEPDWLSNLGSVSTPAYTESVPSQPAVSGDDDLDWLDKLGDASVPSAGEPADVESLPSGDEPDWLKSLGSTSVPTFEEPETAHQASSNEDLSWLKDLGGTPEPASEEPVTAQPSPAQDDLGWLRELGETTEPVEPASPVFAKTDELRLPEAPEGSTKKPFSTAPLNELLKDEEIRDTTPDWLKNAMEEPSMPPPGAVTMDWFDGRQTDKEDVPDQEEPASPQPAFDLSAGDAEAASAQDLDALLSTEMPDWLSSASPDAETPLSETAAPASAGDESLSPVELPSWVQAMRPVDSAIDESLTESVDQVIESEGPLAGFRGVIPSAPIGSSLRPKAFSLKLQATEEQQAGASLLEQIIAAETDVQPHRSEETAPPQRLLRWALSGSFLLVLSLVIGLGLQTMRVVPSDELSSLVSSIPEALPVLVVIDYEPSFSGELEAAAGPLLDQLAMSKRSVFSFVSMSPNGPGLVDRLLTNTGISKPIEQNGLGYQSGAQYFNLGFLAGGSSGVLRFIQAPADEFSQYAAVVLMTDNVESGRVWVEQLDIAGQSAKPFFLVASAQAGPMFQPYVDSGQVDVMVNGLPDAAKYELMNVSRPGTARSYWDAFGYGIMLAVIAIVLGSLWSVFMRIRERRAEAEQG